MVPTRSVKFNLVCGVHGFESVSVDDIRQSFWKAGIFPFNHHFCERFNFTSAEQQQESIKATVAGPVSQRIPSVQKRLSDQGTLQKVADITASALGASRKLQKLSLLLNNSETVNSILLSCSSSRTCSTAGSTNMQKPTFS